VKYGVTRDAVMGLVVVLADGRLVRVGRRTVKGVAGYDLTALFVGSEGTLGVVTQARLRLRPLPAPPTTVVGVFADLAAAGRAVEAALAVATPSLLEIMDNATVRAVEDLQPMGLDTSAAALVLAQSDLPGDGASLEADQLLHAFVVAGASEAYRSEDAEQSELLLGARRMAIPAIERRGRWLLDDVAVPRSRIADAVLAFAEVSAARDVEVCTFGHAGDGNLHPTVVFPHGDDEAAARALLAFEDILGVALRMGGTVTGEHGVGVIKRGSLALELDPVARELHASIKAALDPLGILNPGKALP
jgi:glycolate oxidase